MNGCIISGTSIAVDFWNVRRHPGIKLFFLTHLHGDHVVGLTSSWRQPIYCSPITAQLLIERYGIERSIVRSLDVGQSHLVHYCQGRCVHSVSLSKEKTSEDTGPSKADAGQHRQCDFISVTVIDANHCAGAVMFLFEGPFGKILHTGDFRFSSEMIKEGSPLSKHIGTLDRVYLDNTYCSPTCVFPSRTEALKEIIDVVQSHSKHDVVFGVRGLGKEELLAAVALAVNEWINVPPVMMSFVTSLGLPNIFQTGHPESRLRVVPFQTISAGFVRQLNSKTPTIVVLPTALYQGICGKPYANISEVFVIPYSDHSSYSELHHFVSKLRPACVKPIVQGKVRGPFGVDISCREDMSCFQKYLTKPRHPCPVVSLSDEDSIRSNSTLHRRNHLSCAFQELFPDLMRPSLKKKRSVKKRPRKTLYTKGVTYLSDDETEEMVSPERSEETKQSRVLCTKEKLFRHRWAGNNQNEQDDQKQDNSYQQNLERTTDDAVRDMQKKTTDVCICDQHENMCDGNIQDSALLMKPEESSQTCNICIHSKGRTEEEGVVPKELEHVSQQCDSGINAAFVDCPKSKPNQADAKAQFRGVPHSNCCCFVGLKSMHENVRLSISIQTPTQMKKKTAEEMTVTSPLCSSSADEETSVRGRTMSAVKEKKQAPLTRTVDTILSEYCQRKAVSGRQQRAKLMVTYESIFGPLLSK